MLGFWPASISVKGTLQLAPRLWEGGTCQLVLMSLTGFNEAGLGECQKNSRLKYLLLLGKKHCFQIEEALLG